MSQRKRILVAPLNWGLGHATRCIPVIRELQGQGAEVILASDGRALELLRREFPKLDALSLPGYNIRYYSACMAWNLAWQLPKFLLAVYLEHRQARRYIAVHGINGIISDNRYGCYNSKIPCAFLTHQLFIKIPFRPLEKIVRWLNFRFIKKFDACWVPDVAGERNLSGELAHQGFAGFENLESLNLNYTGALSRMRFFKTKKRYDAIAVLSGPEPQRTFLEEEILGQAKKLPYRFLIVQGKTEKQERHIIGGNIETVSFLGSEDLNEAILSSSFFIGRSGYSTIMDLAKLGKPALLIPTPGQTEQLYLAGKFYDEGIFLTQKQGEINLEKVLTEPAHIAGLSDRFSSEHHLKQTISAFLSTL